MRYFEVEGASVEEALNNFIHEHRVSREFVEYEVIEAGSKGILGIGRKPAKIKISFDELEHLKRKAKITLAELLDRAGFDEYRIEVSEKGSDCILNIQSENSNLLIGKTAQTLDALQYLMEKILRVDERSESRVLVDVENYRERVIEPLKEKAQKLARGVKKNGKSAKLPAMVTMVRKEIHMALKGIGGVSTVSSGDGLVKPVYIVPERKGRKERK